jgi:plastocyanin
MGPGQRHPAGVARATLAVAVALLVAASFTVVVVPPDTVTAAGPTVAIDYPFGFGPTVVKIRVGQTVTWVNKEPIPHGVIPFHGGFTGRSLIAAGKSYTAKFSRKGTFTYHDSYNQTWTGAVVVGSTSTTTAPKATPRPTAKPTVKATPKPTAKATTKPATKPAASATPATVAVASDPPSATAPAAGAGTVSGGSGGSSGSGSSPLDDPSESGFGLGAILAMIGLVALAFVGGTLFASMRRKRELVPLVAEVGLAGSVPQAPPSDPLLAASAGSAAARANAATIASPPPPAAETRYQMPGDVIEDEPLQSSKAPQPDDAEDG